MNETTLPFLSRADLPISDAAQEWLIEKPVMIAIYVVLALLVRWLLHRGIDRITAPSQSGSGPSWWRRDGRMTCNAPKNRQSTSTPTRAARSVPMRAGA